MKEKAILFIGGLLVLSAGSCAPEKQTSGDVMTSTYTISVNHREGDLCPLEETQKKLETDPTYLSQLKEESMTNNKIRVLNSNQPMTMDFRPDRITIVIDEKKKTIGMSCV